MSASILGTISEDPIGKTLGTGFMRFKSPVGIEGLAKVLPGFRLEILAVDANRPGNGHFKHFIEQAKKEFSVICIWHVTSDILEDCLPRYGFRPWAERQCIEGRFEHIEGYRWDK